MDASKKVSPAVRPGCTSKLASCMCIDSILRSTAHQHAAVLTVATQVRRVVGGAE